MTKKIETSRILSSGPQSSCSSSVVVVDRWPSSFIAPGLLMAIPSGKLRNDIFLFRR